MKRKLLYLLSILALVACKKDPEITYLHFSVKDSISVDVIRAEIKGEVTVNTQLNALYLQLSTTRDFATYDEFAVSYQSNQCSVVLTDLSPLTTYYYRYRGKNIMYSVTDSAIRSFQTQNYSKPSVSNVSYSKLAYTSVIVSASVTASRGSEITERGVCYGTSDMPTIDDSKLSFGSGLGSFSGVIEGLQDGTTYYMRAYATNTMGTSYSPSVYFTTKAFSMPTIQTGHASSVSYVSATIQSSLIDDGGKPVTQMGICWSTSANPTISNTKLFATPAVGDFESTISGLADNTTYHVRAFATNALGTSYGDNLTFTTLRYTIPSVQTSAATNITMASAQFGGSVTDKGGYAISECGFCYSTSGTPTIDNSTVVQSILNMDNTFSESVGGLQESTTYYVRAYAKNSKGVGYGDTQSFRTSSRPVYGFSVSATKQVIFAPGNLQYRASVEQWRFAEHQYDFIGADNKNIGVMYDGWIDLFGYGTTGYNNVYPYLKNTSTMYFPNENIQGTNYDWGQYCTIGNGNKIDPAGTWRTLMEEEWDYLMDKRSGAAGKIYQTSIDHIGGLLILPDDWTPPSGFSRKTAYSLSEWNEMENNGAVFLPSAGYRDDYSYSAYYSYYRMSTSASHGYAYVLQTSGNFTTTERYTYYGCSVRLAKDVK